MDLVLGRDGEAAEQRLARFVEISRGVLDERSAHEYVDLRYPNGFAIRSRGSG
jgi:cell division septal protein FtsQ